jgi:hypothetical protein
MPKTSPARKLDAFRDTLDFRDRMFEGNLVEVPTHIDLREYRMLRVPILDQQSEGACTGFGLATVVHYLLRTRSVVRDTGEVSPRMLYEMARRYDEWPGVDYDGSSARGAMKGWHKHGVCASSKWPYVPGERDRELTDDRSLDGLRRPLGAYFRVNHRDLVAMHSAIAEVGILYTTATTHRGWNEVGSDGVIPFTQDAQGGHAFAIVAYDERGFWIQNSWGTPWGDGGFGQISYDDWMANGLDVWVARLGAPVILRTAQASAVGLSPGAKGSRSYAYVDLRPHIVSIGNDGQLRPGGPYGSTPTSVANLFAGVPGRTPKWKQRRLLLYAHGGLTDENSAIQRLADYRGTLLENEVYPISFIWKTDYWTTIRNILEDAMRKRRPEGVLDSAKDFMLDRLDDALEPIARMLTGKSAWDEMKENAALASGPEGGAAIAAQAIASLVKSDPTVEIHIVGHSAGSIFHAYLVRLLTAKGSIKTGALAGQVGHGLKIATCTLWAPACTMDLFEQAYAPAVASGAIDRFALFTLTDKAEQDDNCARIYNKSLLYLVSNAFEAQPRIPLFRDGVPILGMEKFVRENAVLQKLLKKANVQWVLSPNSDAPGGSGASRALQHGAFDDDEATLRATLARVLANKRTSDSFVIHRSEAGLRNRRAALSGGR